MMSSSGTLNRIPVPTVFIGNIPYDLSESMLVDIFQEIGPVKSLRLVNDRETGMAKGYGFCEYYDTATAESAVRNLNNHDLNGRQLRVDFADEHVTKAPLKNPREIVRNIQMPNKEEFEVVGFEDVRKAACQMDFLLGGPEAVISPLPPLNGSDEKVYNLISEMTRFELFELLRSVKDMVQKNFGFVKNLLAKNHQFCRTLYLIQVILGIIEAPEVVSSPQTKTEKEENAYNIKKDEDLDMQDMDLDDMGQSEYINLGNQFFQPSFNTSHTQVKPIVAPQPFYSHQAIEQANMITQLHNIPFPPSTQNLSLAAIPGPHPLTAMRNLNLHPPMQNISNSLNQGPMMGQQGLAHQMAMISEINNSTEYQMQLASPQLLGMGSGTNILNNPSLFFAKQDPGTSLRNMTIAPIPQFFIGANQMDLMIQQQQQGGMGQRPPMVAQGGGFQGLSNPIIVDVSAQRRQEGVGGERMMNSFLGGGETKRSVDGILDEEKRSLLDKIMNLTPQQVEALPPDHKSQVLALQKQFGKNL